jgi:hypothetical protein
MTDGDDASSGPGRDRSPYGNVDGNGHIQLPVAPPLEGGQQPSGVRSNRRGLVITLIVMGALITVGSTLYAAVETISFFPTDDSAVFKTHAYSALFDAAGVSFVLLMGMVIIALALRRHPRQRLKVIAVATGLTIAAQAAAVVAVHRYTHAEPRLRADIAGLPTPGTAPDFNHYEPYDPSTVPSLTMIWTVNGQTLDDACERQRQQLAAWLGTDPGAPTTQTRPASCDWTVRRGHRDTIHITVVTGRYDKTRQYNSSANIPDLKVTPDPTAVTIGYSVVAG